jgi:hypothetical protein
MKLSLILTLITIIMVIINLYLIAMDKVKPTKSAMLFNNFLILLYLTSSALMLFLKILIP